MNVCYFDFADEMPTHPSYWRDGRHVNAKGAELQAEMFARFIDSNALSLGIGNKLRDDRSMEQVGKPFPISSN